MIEYEIYADASINDDTITWDPYSKLFVIWREEGALWRGDVQQEDRVTPEMHAYWKSEKLSSRRVMSTSWLAIVDSYYWSLEVEMQTTFDLRQLQANKQISDQELLDRAAGFMKELEEA